MKKKIAAVFFCCLFAVGLALPLTACGDDPSPAYPQWDANVTVEKGKANVRWNAVEGADGYRVFYSPSRFGVYTEVSGGAQSGTTFVHDDEYGYFRVDAVRGGDVLSSALYAYDIDTFGDNMKIYAPTDDPAEIQRDIDAFREKTGQFSTERFSAFFKSGAYNDLDLVMRYYMTFAGLGKSPADVEIGGFNVYAELSGGNATCNFWCGVENLTVNDDVQWAVSQATSFRRMNVKGNVALTQKGGNSPWGSGGLIADSLITGTVDAGAQQQWLTRNSEWGNWVDGDINMVYVGCEGAFASSDYVWPRRWVTDLDTTTVMREKPFLLFDGEYRVFVPDVKKNYKGVTWKSGDADGMLLPLDEFYVARSDRDTADTINAALYHGKHLLFTPGIYRLDKPITVENENTVILGNGLATLKPTAENHDTVMRIKDVDGVIVSGLIFDAFGSTDSLLEVGEETTHRSHADNPTSLTDVYFRIGGAEAGNTSVRQTLIINSDDVIGDNFWVWRADHSHGVGWNVNETVNGVIVNGDNVTVYGLMVEHFHEYQTVWNGENGFMAFYQSETPYDVPDQESWMSVWNGTEYQGYASYKVADHVQKHTAYGIGVYFVSRGSVFILDHGIEAPSNAEIRLEHLALANFSSPTGSGIRYIVNGYGKDVISPLQNGQKTHYTSFIAGEGVE